MCICVLLKKLIKKCWLQLSDYHHQQQFGFDFAQSSTIPVRSQQLWGAQQVGGLDYNYNQLHHIQRNSPLINMSKNAVPQVTNEKNTVDFAGCVYVVPEYNSSSTIFIKNLYISAAVYAEGTKC